MIHFSKWKNQSHHTSTTVCFKRLAMNTDDALRFEPKAKQITRTSEKPKCANTQYRTPDHTPAHSSRGEFSQSKEVSISDRRKCTLKIPAHTD